ncbi:hypothetical protein ACFQGT_13850 [Natrialbaceae archaeon GCM10025810]|uniref:hypothetical protein n=1 Tax=Halovalidus salilacus TaxID=3075124 RepID=UPI00360F39B1
MFGAYTLGKKAVTFGYKRYGVPGAVASGGVALAGYVIVRRALKSSTNADTDSVTSAIDAEGLERAVQDRGLAAVTDKGTLEDVVNEERLDVPVDLDEVQSSAESESESESENVSESHEDADGGE